MQTTAINRPNAMMYPGNNDFLEAGKVLMEEEMDSQVLQMWSKTSIRSDRFYQTGFETIVFDHESAYALATVLASVLSWEQEILWMSQKSHPNTSSPDAAGEVRLHPLALDNLQGLEQGIEQNRLVHAVVLQIESSEALSDQLIDQLLFLTARHKLTLIVHCEGPTQALNDRFHGGIDYMVGSLSPQRSFVVARRSKLVQTEGNSRSFNLDLYASWQRSMARRNAIIEPMCG
ncbi:hypothetical protein [Geofilum rhodophaeum]|uniref:hypothetical protein n=1 Tax=Geofilum rhodophaeum TaxID=1965019 RepID=UPI000B524F01|nr:hypothetical protein [Geofilum rhodophaeum]